MDLALAIGYGPEILTNLDGLGPLVVEQNVAVVGFRGDMSIYGELISGPRRPDFLWNSLEDVRRHGPKNLAESALSHFQLRDLRGFWIHLDIDVLDDEVMQAVDSRQPDGLKYAELGNLLKVLLGSPHAVGLDMTILDPERDPDGATIDAFVDFLERLF